MTCIRYRPFRNSDPPWLVKIWRSQPPMRGLMPSISVALLEQLVLSKPYFDREGLIIAERDSEPVGFVHGGFGPSADRSTISHAAGTTCMLMVQPHAEQHETRRGLLRASEEYLLQRGAQSLFGGAAWPLSPFYVGLYGGSGLSGVLDDDQPLDELFQNAGYTRIERSGIWHRELAGYRAPIDRRHLRIRRDFEVVTLTDQPSGSWWQACTIDQSFHVQFRLVPRGGGPASASVTFWDMEPMASGWGVHAMGVVDLYVEAPLRRQGLGTYLLGESFRQLQAEGVTLIEAQASCSNDPASQLLTKMGFRERDRASVFCKRVDP